MQIKITKYDVFDAFFEKEIYSGQLDDRYVFRGLPTSEFELLPSALRKGKGDELPEGIMVENGRKEFEIHRMRAEYDLLYKFYKIANESGLKMPYVQEISDNYKNPVLANWRRTMDGYYWPSEELAQLAALAQHYGVVTRMLDWTQTIFVSLYFAAIGSMERALSGEENKWKEEKIVIWAINLELIQFLRRDGTAIPLKFVIPPYSENPNLGAQKGVLSYWEKHFDGWEKEMEKEKKGQATLVDRTPLDELLIPYAKVSDSDVVLLYKFEMPATECVKIYTICKILGYSAAKLFPGYDGVTREMKENSMAREVVFKHKLDTRGFIRSLLF